MTEMRFRNLAHLRQIANDSELRPSDLVHNQAPPGYRVSKFKVGRDGFEPSNSEEDRFTVCCRWPLDYLPKTFTRAREGTRTPDQLITNQLLYQLSYSGWYFLYSVWKRSPIYSRYTPLFLLLQKGYTVFFGKAKVSEFVKFKNFEPLFLAYYHHFMEI